jgi:hypothetical protein
VAQFLFSIVMKQHIIYVWSSGLENWEPTGLLPVIGLRGFVLLHTKTFGHGKIVIYRDDTYRFFATYFKT